MPLPYNPDMPAYQDVEALGHKISPVEGHVDLTKAQRVLVEYFEKKTDGKRFANRADLNPMEIVKYIPNVILFGLIYDQILVHHLHVHMNCIFRYNHSHESSRQRHAPV